MVILDMKMPGMDGKASFQALREIDPQAKVVILSGYSQDGAAHEVLESGALKFFQKPLKYPDLMQWIAETLGENRTILSDVS
jgi:DNA-binding NtrC family response regulator